MAYIVRTAPALQNVYCFLENAVEEGIVLTRPHGILLMKMAYQTEYSRDNTGTPYGAPNNTKFDITLHFTNTREIRELYNRLYSNTPESISLIFNPTFNASNNCLTNFEQGMIIKAYVVDIQEDYDTYPDPDNNSDQMLVSIKLLATKITYIGENDMRVHLHISE